MWKTLIIGISGVTCGGKTTLAQKLNDYLGSNCVILSQDKFYRSEDDPNHEWVDVSPGVRHQNWESMSSMDWSLFTQELNKVVGDKTQISSDSYVIIEGHLIFNYKPIADLCHKKFFITLEREECLKRRTDRKYLPEDPDGYFEGWVWPLYSNNLDQINTIQNHIPIEFLDGSQDPNVLLKAVIQIIKL